MLKKNHNYLGSEEVEVISDCFVGCNHFILNHFHSLKTTPLSLKASVCPARADTLARRTDIRADIAPITRRVEMGDSFIEAIPLRALLSTVETRLKTDPLALLCQRDECGRCDAVRISVGG